MGLTSEQMHWLGGAAFVVVTLLLMAHGAGWLRKRWVPWLLPALLVGYGIERVLVHAQHEAGVRMELMLVQHRAFAMALLTSAVARAVASVPWFHNAVGRDAWLLPLLIFGIEMLAYRETMVHMSSASTVQGQFPPQSAPRELPALA